jgi:hypothetical protein
MLDLGHILMAIFLITSAKTLFVNKVIFADTGVGLGHVF